ncbi:MAG TPA: DegT/DnrJ/EryC1/StrS family aminotransferase [Gammaproteobacteria bacterium]|jgi:dTDP-4-amino-4,6-dideoxygalactose transaminase|nr:DegT/DnrJ/EryC1/StrS family aminotransferase [Gammaproteobacteria bacterium]
MRREFLPFAQPLISQDEIDSVVETLKSDWITTGPKTQDFARKFQEFLHAEAVLPLNSCTAGLHTALVTLGIGPGDEVITTPMTFAASVNVIEHVGAKPILVDVEPDTLNIDPQRIAGALTPRTKAILPVHYSGHPAEMDQINELAAAGHLHVIEDAAHAIPARYKGKLIGSAGNPTAFSFYATKNLTTAEGGALTGPPDFIDRARIVSLHGMSRDAWKRYGKGGNWYYEIQLPGFKYNMTDIQAALGIGQLAKLERFQARRCEIVQSYARAFGDSDALEVPRARPEVDHAWHLYPLRLNLHVISIDRNRFIEEMAARNIGCSVHFIPIHLHPYYRDKYAYRPDDFPIAHGSFHRLVSLPLHPRLTDADVDDVIEAVMDIIKSHRR